MFWNNKKLIKECENLRILRDESLARLDSKSREFERFVALARIEIDKATKYRQLAEELQTKLDAYSATVEEYEGQIRIFIKLVHEVRSIAMQFSPILQIEGLKNNATLKNKLREAQNTIQQIQEQTKVERQ